MSDVGRVAFAVGVACAGTSLAVPLAIRVAHRFALLDHPTGWKTHGRATPYLGGGAVVTGFLAGCLLLLGLDFDRFWALSACTLALCALGTLDDRRSLSARARIAGVILAAAALHRSGLGWELSSSEAVNLLATALFTLGVVNAFNILDLMDGVAAGAGAVAAVVLTALALVLDAVPVAVASAALAGACLGFLLFNLRTPAAIFLGDGGSMAVGFLLSALVMGLPLDPEVGSAALPAAILLVGVPVLDMAFRIYSRVRRGVSVMTPGKDSIANWIAARGMSPRPVTATLAVVQAALGAAVIGAVSLGSAAVWELFLVAATVGATVIVALDRSGFGRGPNVPSASAAPGTDGAWVRREAAATSHDG